ncbi:MAG TPA: serine/threonine-protein kinase, partial [Polyangia bacterium]|nr:serine/threonine-protein kinase [Polyangia bacterium]
MNQRLGDYEILKRLAVGGMAEIFLARVRKLTGFQKMVVIKRILPQLAQNTDFVEMFLDEARIAATLEHPHIVQTYDVGMIDDSYYIAMEYLHGEDVRSIMRAVNTRLQAPPIEQALHIIISAAAGLHYAHEKVGFDGAPLDIVHRDVSPQNLIVTYEGSVKLLDFGIAKASNRLRETRVGTLKGKVPYMSPEQCRSENLDRRSDIYSLGILMWELTLSRRLYRGTSDFEVLKEIVEGRVTPPREIDPTYPPALEAIVMKALEKDRDNRWHTAREMQAELEHFVRKEQIAATPIATQQFMHQLFGDKIEVWRDAQAAGQTLDEHLLTLTPEYSDTKEIEIEDPNAERVKAEREAFIAKLNKPVIIQAIPPAATGTGTGSAQLIIPKSGQFGRIAGAAVALLLTVAAGAYALLSHVQGPSSILPVAAQGDDPLKLEGNKAATNPTANTTTGVGETAKQPPLELDEPPQTG